MLRTPCAALALLLAGCRGPAHGEPPAGSAGAAAGTAASAAASTSAAAPAEAQAAASASASARAAWEVPPELQSPRGIGPYEVPFLGARTVYFAIPSIARKGQRLVANLHGVCNPPGYACGYWLKAGSEAGFLVCPTGNASCGPAAYDAPTWKGSYASAGEDLEKAIATVEAAYPGEIRREGAVLTGFSWGAYAAVDIAARNPGKWPYLILNEANVALSVEKLRKAEVRAVAMIAGERGSQLAGERATAARLAKEGYPARLWVMPGAGHHYSANIDEIMREALAWVLSQP